jgi:predicted RNase H-like nuclease (RuvC/YqgF family)
LAAVIIASAVGIGTVTVEASRSADARCEGIGFLKGAEAEEEPGWTKDLEEELESLIKELKRLEKKGRKKLEEDVIPRIKQEIERLRELLEEFQEEEKGEPPEPRRI